MPYDVHVNTTTHHTQNRRNYCVFPSEFFVKRDVSMLTLDRRRNAKQPPVEPFFESKQIDAVPMSYVLVIELNTVLFVVVMCVFDFFVSILCTMKLNTTIFSLLCWGVYFVNNI